MAIKKLTGFDQSWLSQVENSLSSISLDNMAVLAKAVGVPLWKLLLP